MTASHATPQTTAAASSGVEDLQVELSALLLDVLTLIPQIEDLATTTQPRPPFMSAEAKIAAGRQHRADKRDERLRRAAGAAFGVGARPLPGNLAAISAATHLHAVLADATRHLRAWMLTTHHTCFLEPAGTPSTTDLARHVRAVQWTCTNKPTLTTIARDLNAATDTVNRPRFFAAPMRVPAPGGEAFRGQRSTRSRTHRVGRLRAWSAVVWRCTNRPSPR